MKTSDSMVTRGKYERIFELAANVEDWGSSLPHYRYVRVLRREGNRKLVKLGLGELVLNGQNTMTAVDLQAGMTAIGATGIVNANGQVISIVDVAGGQTITLTYTNGKVTQAQGLGGEVVNYTYSNDGLNNLIQASSGVRSIPKPRMSCRIRNCQWSSDC